MPVEVAGQVRLPRQVARFRLRRRHVHQDSPVADQDRHEQDHLGAHLREQVRSPRRFRNRSQSAARPPHSAANRSGTARGCCRSDPAGTGERLDARSSPRRRSSTDSPYGTSSAKTARPLRPGTRTTGRSNRRTGILPIPRARTARQSLARGVSHHFASVRAIESPPTIQNMSKPRSASIEIRRGGRADSSAGRKRSVAERAHCNSKRVRSGVCRSIDKHEFIGHEERLGERLPAL